MLSYLFRQLRLELGSPRQQRRNHRRAGIFGAGRADRRFEFLEARHLLTAVPGNEVQTYTLVSTPTPDDLDVDADWCNAVNPCDVDGDRAVTQSDVNSVAAGLNTGAAGRLPQQRDRDSDLVDVNGDGVVSSIDLLLVLERIRSQQPLDANVADPPALAPGSPNYDYVESQNRAWNESRPQHTADQGDFYWYYDQKIPLWVAQDEIVVSLREKTRDPAVFVALTDPQGPLTGWEFCSALDAGLGLFKLSGSDRLTSDEVSAAFQQASAKLAESPAVAWTTHVYVEPATGTRISYADQIIVTLQPGVDPSEFFGEQYSGYHHFPVPNTYVAKLIVGGANVLREVDRLKNDPRVVSAEADRYGEIRLTFEPVATAAAISF